MFEEKKRKGLLARFVKKSALDPGMTALMVTPLVIANYPKDAALPILEPRIDQKTIWAATDSYFKGRIGFDDLYQTIFGLGPFDYHEEFMKAIESEEDLD